MHPFYMRIGLEKGVENKKRFFVKKGSLRMGDAFQINIYLDAYDNNVEFKEDWKIVMSRNPKVIFYAHANERVVL